MTSVFFSYSHVDEGLRDQLEKHLSPLRRQGMVETWHDRRIGAGHEFGDAIDEHVDSADIILLLVSPDFLASDYCYDREMMRAMARHEAGEATVIPVILRACLWHDAPFGKLNAAPTDGRPITLWPDRDQALTEVAKAIRGAALPPKRTSGSASSKPSNDPLVHRGRVLDLLHKIYEARHRAKIGDSPYFVITFGETYVQAVVEASSGDTILLEAVSASYAPALWKRLGSTASSRLTALGFATPGEGENFNQVVEIKSEKDLVRAANILSTVIGEVFGVDEFAEPEVDLNIAGN